MKAICEQGAEYVYTDEATFVGENLNDIVTYHFKPDFAIDNLLANNYIRGVQSTLRISELP